MSIFLDLSTLQRENSLQHYPKRFATNYFEDGVKKLYPTSPPFILSTSIFNMQEGQKRSSLMSGWRCRKFQFPLRLLSYSKKKKNVTLNRLPPSAICAHLRNMISLECVWPFMSAKKNNIASITLALKINIIDKNWLFIPTPCRLHGLNFAKNLCQKYLLFYTCPCANTLVHINIRTKMYTHICV